MSYSSEHIQIMDMRFSAHVTVAEFEQWLSQVERFLLKKQGGVSKSMLKKSRLDFDKIEKCE